MCDYESGVAETASGKYTDSPEKNLEQGDLDNDKDKSQVNEKDIISSQQEGKQLNGKFEGKFRCFDPSDTVDIAIEEHDGHVIKLITIPLLFQSICDKLPDGVALCWKEGKVDQWQKLTYSQYRELIYNVAKSFLKVNTVAKR